MNIIKLTDSKRHFTVFVFICILIGIGCLGHHLPLYAQEPQVQEGNDSPSEIDAKATNAQKSSDVLVVEEVSEGEPVAQNASAAGKTEDDGSGDQPSAPVKSAKGDVDGKRDQHAEANDPSSKNGNLVFNFDNADLTEVVRTIAELLHMNYVLDPGVGGKVTIHTAGELKKSDLLPVFYQILELNGFTAVKENNIYHIVPIKDVSRRSLVSRIGRDRQQPLLLEERMIIQVVPLQSVSAQEMIKVLTPFISSEGMLVSEDNANILVVVDRTDNLSKVLRLVEVFDANVFERMSHQFFSLKYGDVESLVDILDKMMSAYGEAFKSDVNFIPILRLNTLLVISSNPRVFDQLNEIIETFDVPSGSTEPGIYVYGVKNGRAEDIASILNTVFAGKKKEDDKKETEVGSSYRNPFGKEAKKEKAEQPKPNQQVQSTGADVAVDSGTLRSEVNITADESRNSLIIEATPADYKIIKNLLKQLDILPRQVLIEVTIAEITLDAKTELGVEWTYKKSDANLSTSLLNATMGQSGLNFAIGNPERWTAALNALASDNKVNILSSPSILASNSKPAKIDVSQEIPVASSQYQYTSGQEPLLETDIEYRDTGIILSVTPYINELGLVTMDIDQEFSEEAPSVSVGGKQYTSFFKRAATTTLTVQNGQTIVIGGLIREKKSNIDEGTPWFSNIPLIGFLFGKTSDEFSKTELIILISPYVIDAADDVEAVTREFKEKVGSLFPETSNSENLPYPRNE